MFKYLILAAALLVGACEHTPMGGEHNTPGLVPPNDIIPNVQDYGILAGSAITCTTAGKVNANIGVSPGTAVTGFPPCTFAGEKHVADAEAAAAQAELLKTYNYLKGLTCNTVVSPADIGGKTLAPGVYCVATSLAITGTVTLDGQGNSDARFVFQMGSTLGSSVGAKVKLINGAQAKNVWWQVGSSATIGTGTCFEGTIAALTSITLNANVKLHGRALARNGAVTLGANVITLP